MNFLLAPQSELLFSMPGSHAFAWQGIFDVLVNLYECALILSTGGPD